MADFHKAHIKSRRNEGGYANVKGDKGKVTYCGISEVFWPNWKGWAIVKKHLPLKHGEIIKDPVLEKLVDEFYKETFWDVVGGDKIEDQVTAERLYDFGITSGQSMSIKQIQGVLNIKQTGRLDAATLAAINDPAFILSR